MQRLRLLEEETLASGMDRTQLVGDYLMNLGQLGVSLTLGKNQEERLRDSPEEMVPELTKLASNLLTERFWEEAAGAASSIAGDPLEPVQDYDRLIEAAERAGEPLRIVGGHAPAIDAIFDELGQSADPRDDKGQPRPKRLHAHHRQTFLARGQNQEVAFHQSTIDLRRIEPARELDSVREAAGERGRERVSVPDLAFGDAPQGGENGASLLVPYGDPPSVRYEYDAGVGAYRRLHGGRPTIDEAVGLEVLPENVVVISTEVTEIAGTSDVAGAPSLTYRGTGSGPVIVLRDGKRHEGTWSRGGSGTYRFADASGTAITLKPGLTWIHILPASVEVQ